MFCAVERASAIESDAAQQQGGATDRYGPPTLSWPVARIRAQPVGCCAAEWHPEHVSDTHAEPQQQTPLADV